MKTKVAKVVAVGLIVTELAVADYALLKMLNNGFEVEISEGELIRAGRAARAAMAEEGEKMLAEEGITDEASE